MARFIREINIKASGAGIGTKKRVIALNSHKYSISAMCNMLKLPRTRYYCQVVPTKIDTDLENAVITEFHISHHNYATRKLKLQLAKKQNGHVQSQTDQKDYEKI